jgi:hypothetical protein
LTGTQTLARGRHRPGRGASALLLACFLAPLASGETALQAVGQLLIPTVHFESGYRRHFNERCTATLVTPGRDSNSPLLLTAWHCLEYYRDLSRPILFEHANGSLVEARQRASGGSMRDDWALLELREALPGAIPLLPVEVATGTAVMMAGFSRQHGKDSPPLTLDRNCSVTSREGEDLGTDCHARRGASGGPVFSAVAPRRYLGIVSRGDSAALSIFVPVSRIIPQLWPHLGEAAGHSPFPRTSRQPAR